MKINSGKRWTAMLVTALALLIVGVAASRTAHACNPDGEPLRYAGELPGGG
jgi:hypothetical protein